MMTKFRGNLMEQSFVRLEPDWGFDLGKPKTLEIRIVEMQGTELHVLGVSHTSIKVGDRFKVVIAHDANENPLETLGTEVADVLLVVKSITAYHRKLNRVNAGMDAAFVLKGDAADLIRALEARNWSRTDNQYHQWCDDAKSAEKIVLVR